MNKLRSQMIVDYLNEHSYASFSSLCDIFQVSPATMRRDLTTLERAGRLIRVHGGAKSLNTEKKEEANSGDRFKISADEKRRIARHIVSLIKNNDTILLDSSSTNCFAAEELLNSNLDLTIATNDIMIANILKDKQNFHIVVIGGYLRDNRRGMVGPFAEKIMKEFFVDKAFIGFDSINIKSGVSIKSIETVASKKLELKMAQKRYLIGESTKFNKNFYYKLCNLSDLDEIITDVNLDEVIYLQYLEKNCKITRV